MPDDFAPYDVAVKADIPESQLPAYAALMGKANAVPVVLNGKPYPAKTVKFVTVAAAWCGNDTYRGELRYLTGDYSSETANLANLSLGPAAPAPQPAPAAPADPTPAPEAK